MHVSALKVVTLSIRFAPPVNKSSIVALSAREPTGREATRRDARNCRRLLPLRKSEKVMKSIKKRI